MCHRLATSPAFSRHAAALQADRKLQANLAALLTPYLARAAIVLPLPPERRPAGNDSVTWPTVHNAARALSHSTLAAGVHALLVPPAAQDAAAGFSAPSRRLLQASCQLLAAAPLEAADGLTGEQPAELLRSLIALLGKAASSVAAQRVLQHDRGGDWPRGSPHQCLQQVRLLAQVTARLPALLRAAVGSPRQLSSDEAAAVGSAAGLLGVLVGSRDLGAPLLRTAEDVPLCCAAAQGALCAALAVGEARAAGGGAAEAAEAAGTAASLVGVATGVMAVCMMFIEAKSSAAWDRGGATPAAPVPAGSTLAAAEAALWGLHTAACRAAQRVGASAAYSLRMAVSLPGALTVCMASAGGLNYWATGSWAGGGKR